MEDQSAVPLIELVIDDGEAQAKDVSDGQFPTIFKVPDQIKKANPGAYEPEAISFGPYHHGNERLKSMENYKYEFLNDLLVRTRIPRNKFFEAVEEVRDRAKSCYADLEIRNDGGDVDDDDDAFIGMMTVDACFLIELSLKICDLGKDRGKIRRRQEGRSNIEWNKLDHVLRDMMLLENQIPFFVLEQVFSVIPDTSCRLLDFFVCWIHLTYEPDLKVLSPLPFEPSRSPHHLVDLQGLFMFRTLNPKLNADSSHSVEQIPSATELSQLNVNFSSIDKAGLKVSFSYATMSMKPIKIDENTGVYLRNLIAFEQGCRQITPVASSYVMFMGSLIKKAEDVSILSGEIKCGSVLFGYINCLLVNKLKDEEEAAVFFGDICKGIEIYKRGPIYDDIDAFCRSRWKRFSAVFRRELNWKLFLNLSVSALFTQAVLPLFSK